MLLCGAAVSAAVGTFVQAGETPAPQQTLARYEFEQVEMSVPIRVVLYAPDKEAARAAAKAAFDRFRALNAVMSDYDETSELRRLCDTAGQGKAVKVSDDLWRVLVRAQEMAKLSDGAFDVTIGPLVRRWRQARRLHELPSAEHIRTAKEAVGYRHIRLDPQRQSVELLKPNMRLDLGGIAKGFAVGEAMKLLKEKGLTRGMIYAGGDMGLGDPPLDKPGWRIGIAPPGPDKPPRLYLWLSNTAVATSGDAWQFVEIDGKRYSHVVDPRTGIGLTDHNTVTVVMPDSTTADAITKAVAILGPEKGFKLIDEMPGAAAFVVRYADGKEQTFASKRWKALVAAQPKDK
jgi:thiamine biosynthesis lipoprotein